MLRCIVLPLGGNPYLPRPGQSSKNPCTKDSKKQGNCSYIMGYRNFCLHKDAAPKCPRMLYYYYEFAGVLKRRLIDESPSQPQCDENLQDACHIAAAHAICATPWGKYRAYQVVFHARSDSVCRGRRSFLIRGVCPGRGKSELVVR